MNKLVLLFVVISISTSYGAVKHFKTDTLISGNRIVVPESDEWIIYPGVTLTFDTKSHLKIEGTIKALGTEKMPVTFKTNGGGWFGLTLSGQYPIPDVEPTSATFSKINYPLHLLSNVRFENAYVDFPILQIENSTSILENITFKNKTNKNHMLINRAEVVISLEQLGCNFSNHYAAILNSQITALISKPLSCKNVFSISNSTLNLFDLKLIQSSSLGRFDNSLLYIDGMRSETDSSIAQTENTDIWVRYAKIEKCVENYLGVKNARVDFSNSSIAACNKGCLVSAEDNLILQAEKTDLAGQCVYKKKTGNATYEFVKRNGDTKDCAVFSHKSAGKINIGDKSYVGACDPKYNYKPISFQDADQYYTRYHKALEQIKNAHSKQF